MNAHSHDGSDDLAPDDAIAVLARKFDLEALQRDASSAAFVGKDGAIFWVNAAWRQFGASNGADQHAIAPGQNYFEAIRGELGPWFTQVASSCLTSGGAFEKDYECSSTDMRREFRMRMLPIPETGLLIVHSLRFERPHDREAQIDLQASRYISENGFIVMCSNCRRVRHADKTRWDWSPSWLTNAPAPVSHGLCHLCLDFYFG